MIVILTLLNTNILKGKGKLNFDGSTSRLEIIGFPKPPVEALLWENFVLVLANLNSLLSAYPLKIWAWLPAYKKYGLSFTQDGANSNRIEN